MEKEQFEYFKKKIHGKVDAFFEAFKSGKSQEELDLLLKEVEKVAEEIFEFEKLNN